jgi:prepilin-type N-terminal cleavage/methylation domain-containing protein/prepilin-type processing-associated H-X9-DG protein
MDCKSGRREDHHENSHKQFIYAMDTKSNGKSRLKSASAQAPSKAMTLVELLVVIAIIGILASLLLSAVSKGRSSALQTQCLGQVKQLSLAMQMYTQDNQDFTPWPNWGVDFQGWLYTPVNRRPPQPSSPPEAVYAGGTLWPYVKEVKIYWCPVDFTNTPYFLQREEKLSSYIMNGAIMGYYLFPPASRTHKLSAMNSSAYVTWEPNDQPPFDAAHVFNDGASYPREDEGPSQRHGSGCNVSSFDGHAQFLSFTVFHREQNDKPGLLWCDPDSPDGSGGLLGRGCGLWK